MPLPTTEIWVNTSSGSGLLPDDTKRLPEPMLTYHLQSWIQLVQWRYHGHWSFIHYDGLWGSQYLSILIYSSIVTYSQMILQNHLQHRMITPVFFFQSINFHEIWIITLHGKFSWIHLNVFSILFSLVPDCSISIANTLEILQSRIKAKYGGSNMKKNNNGGRLLIFYMMEGIKKVNWKNLILWLFSVTDPSKIQDGRQI